MHYSWDLIRTFQAVAQTGSLSAAARALQITQPTVGRHIDLLEDALKLPLFVRSREGMALTRKGADLVSQATEMEIAATGFERHAAGLDEEMTGVVRISANEIMGVMIVPRILPKFMQAYPGIEVELIISNSAANLLRRDADVAIRMFRPTQNDLVARKVADLPLGFFGLRDYLNAKGEPKTLGDLRSHRVIGLDRETSLIDAGRMLGEPLSSGDFAFRCDNILTHIEAIRAGVGIGVTHQGLAANWPEVDQVLPAIQLPSLDLWVACHSEVRHNTRIRAVMDFLGEALQRPYDCMEPAQKS
jgi:DNA-binding transcriptional LysR family regulator